MGYPFKQLSEEELNQLADTAAIQFHELTKFGSALGFEYNGVNFYRAKGVKNKLLKTVTVLSPKNVIRMFNSYGVDWSECGKYAFFDLQTKDYYSGNLIPFYFTDVQKAYANKGIEKVKVQLNGWEMNVLSHKISFCNPEDGKDFVDAFEQLKVQSKQEVVENV